MEQQLASIGNGALGAAAILLAISAVLGLWPVLAGRGQRQSADQPASLWPFRLHAFAWLVITAAMGLMIGLFLADAFGFVYVAERSNAAMATVYKVTALWAGQEGSLLLWLWIQAGFGLIVAWRAKGGRPLDRGAAGILAAISAFFAVLVAWVLDPFALRLPAPVDGAGMNPILQSYWMTSHPVMLYLGYVGLSVPFAYALSSLVTGDDRWIRTTRRWSLVAWTFLSIGILYGARWAYEVLGWGGYWGWDPVENAVIYAVARRDGFHPLRDHRGEAGDAPPLEPCARLFHVPPHHLRHFYHPLGYPLVGARLCRIRHQPMVYQLHGGLCRALSLRIDQSLAGARRRAAYRLTALQGVELSRKQRRHASDVLCDLLGHGLSLDCSGVWTPGDGGHAVL